jgi:hypothetical protein
METKGGPKPWVLFVDNHKSHHSLEVSEICERHQIIMIGLPPNCTRLMQPNDVLFFGNFKLAFAALLKEIRRDQKSFYLNSQNFAPILKIAIGRSAGSTVLKSGFRRTGLHPWDPTAPDYNQLHTKSEPQKKSFIEEQEIFENWADNLSIEFNPSAASNSLDVNDFTDEVSCDNSLIGAHSSPEPMEIESIQDWSENECNHSCDTNSLIDDCGESSLSSDFGCIQSSTFEEPLDESFIIREEEEYNNTSPFNLNGNHKNGIQDSHAGPDCELMNDIGITNTHHQALNSPLHEEIETMTARPTKFNVSNIVYHVKSYAIKIGQFPIVVLGDFCTLNYADIHR